MKYRLGETVSIRKPKPFVVDTEDSWYFDSEGRPVDKDGKSKFVDDVEYVVLDTQEKVDAMNATPQAGDFE